MSTRLVLRSDSTNFQTLRVSTLSRVKRRRGASTRRISTGEDREWKIGWNLGSVESGITEEQSLQGVTLLTRGRRASRRLARANSAYPRLPLHEKLVERASITEAADSLRRPLVRSATKDVISACKLFVRSFDPSKSRPESRL